MNSILRQHARRLLAGLVLLLADGLVFGTTDAAKTSSFVLVAGFLLLLVTVYYLLHGFLTFIGLYGVRVRRKRRLAGSLTGLIGCLVALQSVGELNTRDVLVLLPLVTIGYIYSFYGLRSGGTDG